MAIFAGIFGMPGRFAGYLMAGTVAFMAVGVALAPIRARRWRPKA